MFHSGLNKKILDAIAQSSSDLTFNEQSLMIMFQQNKSVRRSVLVDPYDVTHIVAIQRSASGQIYFTNALERSLHFSVASTSFSDFTNIVYRKGNDIPFYYVPNTVNFYDSTTGICVINDDSQLEDNPIEYCTSCLIEMFKGGLANAFNHNERKRGGNGKNSHAKASAHQDSQDGPRTLNLREDLRAKDNRPNRNFIPSITLGYTNQVTQKYKESRSSIFGHIVPYLRDGNLPQQTRPHLLRLVKKALDSLPCGKCFDVEKHDDGIFVRLRKSMISDFEELMGIDTSGGTFRVEGIAILIPFNIAEHRDTMNCSVEGMNNVCAIHVKIPIDDLTLNPNNEACNELREFLKTLGYESEFPCCVILYSRKCCSAHCKREAKIIRYQDVDALHDCLFWALTKQIGDIVDYNSIVWDNDEFTKWFFDNAESIDSSRYSGLAVRSIAKYDKMVSICFGQD